MGLYFLFSAQTDGNYQSKSRRTGLELRHAGFPVLWMLIHRDVSSAGGVSREGRKEEFGLSQTFQ